mmetsp:Transcript_54152/g.128219  ORF Transcript_54152/g.128219 Transcript_54152/m.128219 type:complete len:525 (+) Transcript_54152:290-1864(+)
MHLRAAGRLRGRHVGPVCRGCRVGGCDQVEPRVYAEDVFALVDCRERHALPLEQRAHRHPSDPRHGRPLRREHVSGDGRGVNVARGDAEHELLVPERFLGAFGNARLRRGGVRPPLHRHLGDKAIHPRHTLRLNDRDDDARGRERRGGRAGRRRGGHGLLGGCEGGGLRGLPFGVGFRGVECLGCCARFLRRLVLGGFDRVGVEGLDTLLLRRVHPARLLVVLCLLLRLRGLPLVQHLRLRVMLRLHRDGLDLLPGQLLGLGLGLRRFHLRLLRHAQRCLLLRFLLAFDVAAHHRLRFRGSLPGSARLPCRQPALGRGDAWRRRALRRSSSWRRRARGSGGCGGRGGGNGGRYGSRGGRSGCRGGSSCSCGGRRGSFVRNVEAEAEREGAGGLLCRRDRLTLLDVEDLLDVVSLVGSELRQVQEHLAKKMGVLLRSRVRFVPERDLKLGFGGVRNGQLELLVPLGRVPRRHRRRIAHLRLRLASHRDTQKHRDGRLLPEVVAQVLPLHHFDVDAGPFRESGRSG